MLDDGTIPRVAALLPAGLLAHHDDVGIGAVTQEARHGGLGKHQQIARFTELGQHLGTQSSDAQSAWFIDGRLPVSDGAALGTQEHEVSACQPTQQIGHITAIGAAETLAVIGVDIVGQPQNGGGQRSRVVGNLTGIRDDHRKQPHSFGQRPAVDRLRKLDVDPGLVDGVGTGLSGVDPDIQQGAVDIAVDAQRRMHQRDVTHA